MPGLYFGEFIVNFISVLEAKIVGKTGFLGSLVFWGDLVEFEKPGFYEKSLPPTQQF